MMKSETINVSSIELKGDIEDREIRLVVNLLDYHIPGLLVFSNEDTVLLKWPAEVTEDYERKFYLDDTDSCEECDECIYKDVCIYKEAKEYPYEQNEE